MKETYYTKLIEGLLNFLLILGLLSYFILKANVTFVSPILGSILVVIITSIILSLLLMKSNPSDSFKINTHNDQLNQLTLSNTEDYETIEENEIDKLTKELSKVYLKSNIPTLTLYGKVIRHHFVHPKSESLILSCTGYAHKKLPLIVLSGKISDEPALLEKEFVSHYMRKEFTKGHFSRILSLYFLKKNIPQSHISNTRLSHFVDNRYDDKGNMYSTLFDPKFGTITITILIKNNHTKNRPINLLNTKK